MLRHNIQSGILCCLLLVSMLAGCASVSTQNKFYESVTVELKSGKTESAILLLEEARQNKKFEQKDRLLYFIDAGMLNHYAGQYSVSNTKFELAEQSADELFTKSISRAAASILLNDNVLEYAGEDFELIYTNLISALNYINEDKFDDAFVEIRRANLKLDVLEQKYADASGKFKEYDPDDTNKVRIDYDIPKVRFHNDAFGRYLSMHLYAADGKLDDARIDHDFLTDAFRDQPHVYDFKMPEVKYWTENEGNTILSIVGLAGLAPVKRAMNLRIRTDKDLDLIQVLYDNPGEEPAEYGHFPAKINEDFFFKFAIPVLSERPSAVDNIRVLIDGQPAGHLQLIEDVGKVAHEVFEAKKGLIYLKSVIRAITKGLATHRLKKKADTGGLGGWLKKAAIDIGTDLSENADLRSCQYLPGRIFVADFEVTPGVHDIAVEFYHADGTILGTVEYAGYEVISSGLNMLEAFSVD